MSTFYRTISFATLALISIVLFQNSVFAQTPNNSATPTVNNSVTPGVNNSATPGVNNSVTPNSTGGTLTNPLNAPDLQTLLYEVLDYVVLLGGIFLTIMLVFVGFKFVMAQGNPEAVSGAKSMLMWTAIGGVLLLGAKAIAIVITSTASSL